MEHDLLLVSRCSHRTAQNAQKPQKKPRDNSRATKLPVYRLETLQKIFIVPLRRRLCRDRSRGVDESERCLKSLTRDSNRRIYCFGLDPEALVDIIEGHPVLEAEISQIARPEAKLRCRYWRQILWHAISSMWACSFWVVRP